MASCAFAICASTASLLFPADPPASCTLQRASTTEASPAAAAMHGEPSDATWPCCGGGLAGLRSRVHAVPARPRACPPPGLLVRRSRARATAAVVPHCAAPLCPQHLGRCHAQGRKLLCCERWGWLARGGWWPRRRRWRRQLRRSHAQQRLSSRQFRRCSTVGLPRPNCLQHCAPLCRGRRRPGSVRHRRHTAHLRAQAGAGTRRRGPALFRRSARSARG